MKTVSPSIWFECPLTQWVWWSFISSIPVLSLNLFEVPLSWKHSLVFPAYKSGESTEAVNYRSISIVPVITKIVESAVHKQVYRYLSQNHLLWATQHGFRPRHSTETVLITISDDASSCLRVTGEPGEVSLLRMLDLSKCFDVISHNKLLITLRLHDIDTSWFSTYTSGHITQGVSFRVNAGDARQSVPLDINIGIFHGSALGPLLYSIFANDLSLVADDATIVQYAYLLTERARRTQSYVMPLDLAFRKRHKSISCQDLCLFRKVQSRDIS